jgi:hypothetical protein
MNVLLTFTGFHDPYAVGLIGSSELPGPIVSVVRERNFDHVILFETPNTKQQTYATKDALALLQPGIDIEIRSRAINFASGAKTELMNWTGGMPVLYCDLCKTTWERAETGANISPQQINQWAEELFNQPPDYLQSLWKDCTTQERGILAELAEGREFKQGEDYKQPEVRKLIQCGYIKEERGALKISCRAMENFARQHGSDSTALYRLFGTSDNFNKNSRGLLELRFSQIERIDGEMHDSVSIAIQNLHKPHIVIEQIRSLVNRAFKRIWDAELPDRQIPPKWTQGWKQGDSEGNNPELNPPEGRVPTRGGAQCNLLRLMVDHRKAGRTRVSPASYYLINYLQSVGDFGQHNQDEQIPTGFAVTTCLAAIQLCDQLAQDLGF